MGGRRWVWVETPIAPNDRVKPAVGKGERAVDADGMEFYAEQPL